MKRNMNELMPDLIICGIVILTLIIIHLFGGIARASLGGYDAHETLSYLVESHVREYSWLLKILVNCFGYSCVFVPGYLIYKYVESTKYLEKSGKSYIYNIVNVCLKGSTTSHSADTSASALKRTTLQEVIQLLWCFAGLMCFFLTWGVLQEKIMTQQYMSFAGASSHFKDSQFLVFANRLSAFLVATIWLQVQSSQVNHIAPFYKYSFASFSNIMSAWFQYEALKYVNFPTQVLAKSCKIIPVMLIGKIMSKNRYEFYEYLTAVLISLGMVLFMTGSRASDKTSGVTTLTGVFLLAMYMLFDSFTANWQGDLFKTYGMSPLQMMRGVNLFSMTFTAVSLSVQGGFMDSLSFATEHPKFVIDVIVLSMSSAVGQLFIYYTLSLFGPIVFTIIMTLRQAVAIMLSCLIYHHNISYLGIFGVVIVFLAIFLRVYCNQRMQSIRKRLENARPKIAV